MNDPRKDVYEDLHSGQLKAGEQANRVSADRILTIVEGFWGQESEVSTVLGMLDAAYAKVAIQ